MKGVYTELDTEHWNHPKKQIVVCRQILPEDASNHLEKDNADSDQGAEDDAPDSNDEQHNDDDDDSLSAGSILDEFTDSAFNGHFKPTVKH